MTTTSTPRLTGPWLIKVTYVAEPFMVYTYWTTAQLRFSTDYFLLLFLSRNTLVLLEDEMIMYHSNLI